VRPRQGVGRTPAAVGRAPEHRRATVVEDLDDP
jgi:hypothetical protein